MSRHVGDAAETWDLAAHRRLRGDGLTVAVAGQQGDQDPLHATPGDGLPAAGLASGVG